MNISDEYRKVIIDDFRFASKMMQSVTYAEQKLFHFSATFGTLLRVFNMQYDPQLVFAYLVFNSAYATINARIAAIKTGDPTIEIPEDFFPKLAMTINDFADKIDRKMDTFEILQRVAELSYISTGNGFYLFQKGLLKL